RDVRIANLHRTRAAEIDALPYSGIAVGHERDVEFVVGVLESNVFQLIQSSQLSPSSTSSASERSGVIFTASTFCPPGWMNSVTSNSKWLYIPTACALVATFCPLSQMSAR